MSKHPPEDGLEDWSKGKFRHGRYIGQLYGNTDWAFTRLVWSTALMYERSRKAQERCEYCGPGKDTGLPGGACENCMNTGLKNPEPVVPRGKPDWNSHPYDQIFQTSDGNWFGAIASWNFEGNFSSEWKGDQVSLLRSQGEFLAYGDPNPNWKKSLEKRPVQTHFNPAKGSRETADQMAAVMLQHGTPEQQVQALEYASDDAVAARQARADIMDPQEVRWLIEEIDELKAELAKYRSVE